MIQISRSACPPSLKSTPQHGIHYNKQEVVDALWGMQYGKCCYCEMRIPQEGHSKAVEHFRPQSVFKGLKNDWSNLLLACPQCNGKKSNKFPIELTDESGATKVVYIKRDQHGSALIIDPSEPDLNPEEHIGFIVVDDEEEHGICHAKNSSNEGSITIQEIGLDRSFYTKQRREYYTQVLVPAYLNLLSAKDSNDAERLEVHRLTFNDMLCPSSKFSAFARAFARCKRVDEKFGVVIP